MSAAGIKEKIPSFLWQRDNFSLSYNSTDSPRNSLTRFLNIYPDFLKVSIKRELKREQVFLETCGTVRFFELREPAIFLRQTQR